MGMHGSLNKAGKVRKATKKVPKKMKVKTPMGRAKMRARYNKNVYFMKQTRKKNHNTQEVAK